MFVEDRSVAKVDPDMTKKKQRMKTKIEGQGMGTSNGLEETSDDRSLQKEIMWGWEVLLSCNKMLQRKLVKLFHSFFFFFYSKLLNCILYFLNF